MNFQELGQVLKEAREAKGLSIQAVMEATKISRNNIIALEEGNREGLPHPVYTKGFVKSYARLLGLDPDELAMVVDREYQAHAHESEKVSYVVSPLAEKGFDSYAPVKRRRSVWPSILLVLVLACGAVVLVLNLNKSTNKEHAVTSSEVNDSAAQHEKPAVVPQTGETAPEADQATAPSTDEQAAPAQEEQAPDQSAQPEKQSGDQATQLHSENEAPVASQQEAGAPAPAVADSEAADDQNAEVADTGESTENEPQYAHVLVIRATTDKGCWIGVWRGNETKMSRDFVLKKGEPLRLMFNTPRRIRLGNVAGVTVLYNGKPYPLEKNTSNIQTLTFGLN